MRPNAAELVAQAEVSYPWQRRRTEKVEFFDELTISRTTTIEVDIKDFTQVSDQVVLPMGLHDFDTAFRRLVIDSDGSRAGVLLWAEERMLLAEGWAEWSMIDESDPTPQLTLEERRDHIYEALNTLDYDGLLDLGKEHGDRARFLYHLAHRLGPYLSRRLVLAVASGGTERRRCVEESHLEPSTHLRLRLGKEQFTLEGTKHFFEDDRRMPWKWDRVWDDIPVTIPALAPLDARSYHLEIDAPPGTFLDPVRCALILAYVDSNDEVKVEVLKDKDQQINTSRFHIDPVNKGLTNVDVFEPAAAVILRPLYRGALRAAFWVSLLATTILGFLTFTVAWERADWPTVHRMVVRPDSDALVAILLLAPALFLAVIIRENEHPITKVVMEQLRQRLSGLLVIVVSAAIITGLGVEGSAVGWTFVVGFTLAVALTAITARSAWYSRWATMAPRFDRDDTIGVPSIRSGIASFFRAIATTVSSWFRRQSDDPPST